MAKTSFKSLLASAPQGLNKEAAGIESPDEVQMERDFGNMAYLFLKDRAPGLIPYILGFEVVDREEDGSRAVGIFGFKLGEQYYYVPAFFTNGQIKGMDLLYSKSANVFMPLRESWVNNILNKQTITLGVGAGNVDNLRRTFEQPRFDFLAVPPNLPAGTVPKVAESDKACCDKIVDDVHAMAPISVIEGEKLPWYQRHRQRKTSKQVASSQASSDKKAEQDSLIDVAQAGFSVWNDMQQAMVDMLNKDAEFQEAWAGAISRIEKQPLPFAKTAENSDLIGFMQYVGGPAAAQLLLNKLTTDHSFAKAALSFYPSVESLHVTDFDASLAPVKVATRIEIETERTSYHDGKAVRRLVRDGFTIKDNRDEAEKSEVYDVEYPKRFCNPDRTGVYNVLMRNGGTQKAWVFQAVAANGGAASDAITGPTASRLLVVEPVSRRSFSGDSEAIYVRGEEITDGPDFRKELIPLTDMEVSSTYMLVSPHGTATMPFSIRSVISENDKRMRVSVSWEHSMFYPRARYGGDFDSLHHQRGSHFSTGLQPYRNPDILQFGSHKGCRITKSDDYTWIIPSDWQALKLSDPGTDEAAEESYEVQESKRDLFTPGTLADIDIALSKHAFHKLAVEHDGVEYHIRFDDQFQDGHGINYKTAMLRLVSRYGLKPDDAEDILKEASDNTKARRLVKLGQYMNQGAPSSNLVGFSMPGDPGLATGIDSFTGATTVQPQVDLLRGTTIGQTPPINSIQPGFNLGGEAQQDIQAANLASQAAQAGQKKVFDHAAIGGLSKVYDANSVIDTYIPELTKSLDRVGRILFLFYWKNEEFSERYGSEDMAEMEDLIRGVFKSFGDLVLQLKKKSVEPSDVGSDVM